VSAPQSFVGRFRAALVLGTQWRYLLVFVAGTLLPSVLALAPAHRFFGDLFNTSPRAGQLVARLDSAAFFEVMRQLGEPAGMAVVPGVMGSLIVTLAMGPALAGAAATVALSDTPPTLSALLAGAGRLYLRMFRMALVSILPVGVAAAAGGALVHFVGKANAHVVLDGTASRNATLAWLALILLVALAEWTVEAGRAVLVAEPDRRSAFRAWLRAVRLTLRRPAPVLGMCAGTTIASLLLAALLTALRLRLFPAGWATIALDFLVAQAAVAAVGWGRASRLAGLVDIVRAEAPAQGPSAASNSSGDA
jgi:hypothetical protein